MNENIREGLGCIVGVTLTVGSLAAGGVVIFGTVELLVGGENSGVRLLLLLFSLWVVFVSLAAAAITYRRLMRRWFGEGVEEENAQYRISRAPLRDAERVVPPWRSFERDQHPTE
jgi:hypothetical protein